MSRTPARFKQADVQRAIRAAKKTGVDMVVDILLDGTIRLVPVAHVTIQSQTPPVEPEEVLVF